MTQDLGVIKAKVNRLQLAKSRPFLARPLVYHHAAPRAAKSA